MTEIPHRADMQVLEAYITSPELLDVTMTLLGDTPPRPVDAIFFFGRSYFDAEKKGISTLAADLVKQGRATDIFLADSEGETVGGTVPRVAYPGKSLWTDRLNRLGVGERIQYCAHPEGKPGFHTRTEAEAFVQTAAEKGFKSAVILAHPHQITRAMLSVIKVINEKGLDIDVWCMTPPSTDWDKKVMGSQGMKRKPRSEHIQDEIDRIFRYQAKGDIASFDELFSYLAKRENRQT